MNCFYVGIRRIVGTKTPNPEGKKCQSTSLVDLIVFHSPLLRQGSKRERVQDSKATMALRENTLTLNVIAKAYEPSKQRVAQSAQKQQQPSAGSTFNPYSFLSADKASEHASAAGVQIKHGPVVQTSSKFHRKPVTIPMAEMKSLNLVQANPNVQKKKKNPVESKTTLPRLNFGGAVRPKRSNRSALAKPYSLISHTGNKASTMDSYMRALTSWSTSKDPHASTLLCVVSLFYR